MFKGFMDESGIDLADKACAVAGFVGSEEICDRTAEKWNEALKPIGLFHAEDFFRRPRGKMTGVYEGIHPDDADSCAYALIDILKVSGLEPLGMAIHSETFRSLSQNERRWMTSAVLYGRDWPMQGSPNNPYFACFHYCVAHANQFTPEGENIYLTFDRQDTYVGNAQKIYDELKKIGGKFGGRLSETLAFSSKKEAVLLQAADLLAYSIGQRLNERRLNQIVEHALNSLAYEKEYIRAMDCTAIDFHLRKCPFRTTFWQGLTDPDIIEQAAGQGLEVLTYKADERLYLTHHLKAERVKVIGTVSPQPLEGRKRTEEREDSTN